MVATRLKTTVASATKQQNPPSPQPPTQSTPPQPTNQPPDSLLSLQHAYTFQSSNSPPSSRHFTRSPSSPYLQSEGSPPALKASRFTLSPKSSSLAPLDRKLNKSPSASSLPTVSAITKFTASMHGGHVRRSSEQLVEIVSSSSANLSTSERITERENDVHDDTPVCLQAFYHLLFISF